MRTLTHEVFDGEVHPRYRDVNLANHVDSVEAIRIIDEARIQFLRFAPLPSATAPRPGLLGGTPDHVGELVGAQQVEYRTEMRFVPFQPFLLRLWVCHVGGASFDVATELRIAADHEPALAAVTTMVLWDEEADRPWSMDADLRDTMDRYLAEPVALRRRD